MQGENESGEHTLEPEFTSELQNLQLSKLSSNGFDGAQTFKLFMQIGNCHLLTMIDSGASHCFISDRATHNLYLPVDPTAKFAVVLGDGSRVSS